MIDNKKPINEMTVDELKEVVQGVVSEEIAKQAGQLKNTELSPLEKEKKKNEILSIPDRFTRQKMISENLDLF